MKTALKRAFSAVLALCLCLNLAVGMGPLASAAEVKIENADPAVVTTAVDGTTAWDIWQNLSFTTWNPEKQADDYAKIKVTVNFTGTGLTMFGQKAANGPTMSVTIDGTAAADADFYGTGASVEIWKSAALENVAHTAVFTLKNTWNAAAAPDGQLGNLQAAIDYFLVGGTTEPPVPETENYVKDYEDGVSGTWSGVTATVIPDPANEANKILELKDFLRPSESTHIGLGIDTSAPNIANGTISMKMKTSSFVNFGFVYRAENSLKEANQLVNSPTTWFACNEGSHGAGYPVYPNGKHLQDIAVDTWHDVKLQFSGTNVEIALDGVRYGVFDAGKSSTNAGTFGFRVWNLGSRTVYVDDVRFTTEMLDMGTLYEEPPLVIPRITYTSSAATTPSVPARKAALDTNAPNNAYGLNTWYLTTAAEGGFGVAFNATSDSDFNAVYTTGAGDFKLRLPDGTEKVLTDNGPVMPKAAQVKVQVAHIGTLCTLYVNGVEVASLEDAALSATSGKIGLYNPGASAATVSLASCAVYELFYYENDFSDAAALGGWSAGTPTKTEDGKLKLNMNFVGNAVAMDTPLVTDGIYEFDFQNELPKGADPVKDDGRVALLFRAYESEYQGLFYDVGSNWFWITEGPYGGISVDGALHAGEAAQHVKLTVNGTSTELELDGKTVYSGTTSALSPTPGRFGMRKQYSASSFIMDNLKISELCAVRPDDVPAVPETITGTDSAMTVTMDKVFPRVMQYKVGESTLLGNQQKAYGLILNGKTYYPLVTAAKAGADTLNYTLAIPTLETTVKLKYQVVGNELKMTVTDIAETGAFKVESLAFEDAVLLSTTASDTTASHASVETLGGWFQTQDVIYDNPTEMEKAPLGTSGRGYAMLSSGGLAGTVNNSGIEAATKLTAKFYQDENEKVIGTIGDGTLTVRTPLDLKNNTRRLPWSTVAICADYNGDSTVDWQDAAANYRNIRTEIYGMDTMKDNMMYITMNFASQVQQPFLRTLDLGKSIYNYTDGFGQMVMHKGFAAEGHDDSHADYGGHVGVRQGGAADFNYAMEQGEKYNMKYGIHINVSEHNPDAYYFNEDIMHRPLGANWGWIDQAYWVNEREDILSGNRAENLARLKDTLPKLAFTYIDIYNGSTWMAEDLVKELNKNGFIAGTEFGGSMELGAAFTHWGHDRAYPNHGNNSTILRFVKPDLDIFVTNALFNGSNMPLVGSWGNANNVKDASQSFFNNVLPAKYLQHLNVLKVTDTSVTFSDGVKTERKGDTVEMTKNGKLMASWAWIDKVPAAGAEDPQNWAASDTGPATVFIPWYGEASTAKNPEEAAKVYHWNPKGGTTSWDVPTQWTTDSITSADVYQLSGDKKEKISTVAVENGKITLTAAAETGYVLYPAGTAAPKVATGFGSGSGMQNTGFEDTSLAGWTVDKAAGADASVMKAANWETRLQISGSKDQSASLTQPITGLEAGKDYTLYLFANAGETGRVDVTVTAGDETYTSAALPTTQRHFDQSKYFNLAEDAGAYDNFQKVSVPFHVPAGVTTATLTIKGTLGADSGKVFADDVTLFDNLTVPKIAGRGDYKDYVLYEDFENVDQGLGAFTYSYLSGGYTHLAEYKAEMNQFTDYVVNGNFSLKSNEFSLVGEALRTRPNQSKLEANTQYELTCRYETGVNGAYALTVKRPDGTVVCSAPLDAVPLRGEGTAVKVSFATGDYDDAYLALEYKADITKLPYASTGEKPEGSGMEYYYLSLDDVAIKKAETGAGEKIVSLGAMRTNTYKGVAPVLMGRVAATYEGGRKGYVDVVWAEIDPATLAAAGTLTVKGTVQGTALPAEYTVTVMETESMASTADLRALVSYGKAQQKAPAYAFVIPAVKTAFEQALTAAEAGCGEAAPDTQPSGSYYTLLARTHLLGYVGDKAQLDALYLASKDLTRGDTAEADWVAFTKALARAKTALTAENILQAEYDLLHQQLTAAVAALKETPPYIPPENPSRDPNKKTETVKNEDGSTTKTVTDKKTGDAVATTKYPDGTKVVTNIPKTGEPTAKVTVPAGKERVTVTVPIKNATPGMVAIIVHADGTEEIVKCSATTKDGMKVQLKEGATLKFKDNSKQFDDVKTDAWHADAVAFASSRELFNGVSAKEFAPELPMTRSMLVTVLCRLSGDPVTQGETWFAGSMDWAKEQKISDGTNPEAKISRESLAVMLYRYAKADKVAAGLTAFSDAEGVSDWAQDAMNWAVKIGLINGKDGKLAPADDASRAEVATMLQRFVEVVELAG